MNTTDTPNLATEPAAQTKPSKQDWALPKTAAKTKAEAANTPAIKSKATTEVPVAKTAKAVKARPAAKETSAKETAAKETPAKKSTTKQAPAPKALAAPSPAVAKPGKKTVKPPRPVLVRDSFTMPEDDFALLAQLKASALKQHRAAKKSELLRAGLQLLVKLDGKSLVEALDRLAAVKTGRPKKGH